MALPSRPKKRRLPNPFYVLILVASTLFVLTCLAYLVSPLVYGMALEAAAGAKRGEPVPGAGAGRLALWLDRRGPMLLAAEFLVMLAAGLLAMATDRWFPSKPGREGKTPG